MEATIRIDRDTVPLVECRGPAYIVVPALQRLLGAQAHIEQPDTYGLYRGSDRVAVLKCEQPEMSAY